MEFLNQGSSKLLPFDNEVRRSFLLSSARRSTVEKVACLTADFIVWVSTYHSNFLANIFSLNRVFSTQTQFSFRKKCFYRISCAAGCDGWAVAPWSGPGDLPPERPQGREAVGMLLQKDRFPSFGRCERVFPQLQELR